MSVSVFGCAGASCFKAATAAAISAPAGGSGNDRRLEDLMSVEGRCSDDSQSLFLPSKTLLGVSPDELHRRKPRTRSNSPDANADSGCTSSRTEHNFRECGRLIGIQSAACSGCFE
eukprot:3721673-Rhodomonas_salina.1